MNYIFSDVFKSSSIQSFCTCIVPFTFLFFFFSFSWLSSLWVDYFPQSKKLIFSFIFLHKSDPINTVVSHVLLLSCTLKLCIFYTMSLRTFFFSQMCFMAIAKNSSQFPNKGWFRMYGCRGRMWKGKFTTTTAIFLLMSFSYKIFSLLLNK